MARRIPRATVTVVASSGHAVHLERPRAVIEALLAAPADESRASAQSSALP
jgi:pimeloyl-ACP methyl ester carboxylesterase